MFPPVWHNRTFNVVRRKVDHNQKKASLWEKMSVHREEHVV